MAQSADRISASLWGRENCARHADWLAVAIAAALPWSTSVTLAFIALWLMAVVGSMRLAELRRELVTPAGGLPVALWLTAAAGLLWATAPWPERMDGFASFLKLLAIPFLIAQFRRSGHGTRVLVAFLASCTVLLVVSWALVLLPGLPWRGRQRSLLPMYGIPVKDYISQSMVFMLCIFGLLETALQEWGRGHRRLACAAVVLATAFLANILYVATSRTALVALPILLLIFVAMHLRRRTALAMLAGFALLTTAAWPLSPFLQERVLNFFDELRDYRPNAMETSAGQRIDFWRNGIAFVMEAPIIGHGTGAIREQFRRTGGGRIGEATNPHNQLLGMAMQLGLVGVILLLAMWTAHLRLLCRPALMTGLGVVLVGQNIISSLFNSSLFDFTHGAVYVLGVGVLGGMALREARDDLAASRHGASSLPVRDSHEPKRPPE